MIIKIELSKKKLMEIPTKIVRSTAKAIQATAWMSGKLLHRIADKLIKIENK